MNIETISVLYFFSNLCLHILSNVRYLNNSRAQWCQYLILVSIGTFIICCPTASTSWPKALINSEIRNVTYLFPVGLLAG